MARGLFPFPLAAYQLGGAPKQEPPKQGGAQQVGSRRGFMGAFQRKSLPRTLQVIGATLQQMDNPAGQLDQFAATEADALRQMAEEAALSRQQKDLEQAIGTLPESQRPWARLAPEQAVRGMFGPAPARYGELERIDGRLGQRNEITGQYEWAPQIPSGMIPQAPTGYRFTPDGNLEAIRGGPQDQRVNETGRRRGMALQDSADNLQNVLGALDAALPQVSGETTGFWGQVTRGLGGTDAYDLREALEPVVANLGFEALAEMRRNSETGGALGQVAVREIELLQRTVRSLDTAQSEQQLRTNMLEVRRQVARTLQAVRAAQQELQGAAPEEPDQSGQQQERVLQWSPERGVY